jgi:hypothetical protein
MAKKPAKKKLAKDIRQTPAAGWTRWNWTQSQLSRRG